MTFKRARLLYPVLVAGALAALPATAASAATVSVVSTASGPELNVTAAAGEVNDITLVPLGGNDYLVDDAVSLVAGAGCTLGVGDVSCFVPGLDHVRLDLGDGDDTLTARPCSTPSTRSAVMVTTC